MTSTEEAMEEPPAAYMQTRRRSNTLPTEILRHLRDRRQKQKSEFASDDSSDETDGGILKNHSHALNNKFKKVTICDGSSNESLTKGSKPSAKSPPKSCLSNSRHRTVASYDDEPFSQKLNSKHRPRILRDNLMRTASDDTLVLKSRRKPLPRGSNVYEKALEDFGHNEEERDSISPLPSPEILRRNKLSAKNSHRDDPKNLGEPLSSSPPRHVHWGQGVKERKPKR